MPAHERAAAAWPGRGCRGAGLRTHYKGRGGCPPPARPVSGCPAVPTGTVDPSRRGRKLTTAAAGAVVQTQRGYTELHSSSTHHLRAVEGAVQHEGESKLCDEDACLAMDRGGGQVGQGS